MGNQHKEAWDTLTEEDFIHSCDCVVCKSLRDDSGRSCSGCAQHHVLNKSLRSRIAELEGQVATLEEYMLKGVAFRDELQAKLATLGDAAKDILANGYDQGRRIALRAALESLNREAR